MIFPDLPSQCRHYLRLAAAQPIGLILRCPDQQALAGALARARAEGGLEFKHLQIRLWPNDEIVLVKGKTELPDDE